MLFGKTIWLFPRLNAETYLAKMRKEIEVAREELAQLEEKIKAINSQFEQR